MFLLIDVWRAYHSISWYLNTCIILSIGNSFKTCIISVDLGKAFKRFSLFNRYIPILNPIARHIEDILGYHKLSVDTLNALVIRTYNFPKNFFLSVLHDQTSVDSLLT